MFICNRITMSASWWQASDSNSWEWRSSDWKAQSWKQSPWDNQSSSNHPTTQCPTPTFPASFVSDTNHYDKMPVGKGCHVLHRCVQPTEWSRKTGLAGRDVADVRAYELSHRGFADFHFASYRKAGISPLCGPEAGRNLFFSPPS